MTFPGSISFNTNNNVYRPSSQQTQPLLQTASASIGGTWNGDQDVNGSQISYLGEVPARITALANLKPVGKVDKSLAADTSNYLLLLVYSLINRDFMGIMTIQNTYGFDEYGNDWPMVKDGKKTRAQTVEEMINDLKPEVLPAYLKTKLLALYQQVKTDPEMVKMKAEYGLKEGSVQLELQYFSAMYNKVAEVFLKYDEALKEYNMFKRLSALRGQLSNPDLIKLPAQLDYETFDPKVIAEQLKKINVGALSAKDKEMIDEILVICTYLVDRYMMAMVSGVQNKFDFDSYGKPLKGGIGDGWPMSGKAPMTLDKVLALPQVDMPKEVKNNLLRVYNAIRAKYAEPVDIANGKLLSETYNISATYKEFWYFQQTYYYYQDAFSVMDGLINFDPFEKIKLINEKDLCQAARLNGLDVERSKFSELDFLAEVKKKITPENLQACVTEIAQSWEFKKGRLEEYIRAVYMSLGVDLAAVQGAGGKTGLVILDGLLARGHKDNDNPASPGIVSEDIWELTQRVEQTKKKDINRTEYEECEVQLHDTSAVPKKLLPNDFTGMGVMRKLNAQGIYFGARTPQGSRVSE